MAAPDPGPAPALRREAGHWVGSFRAMASPCELLMDLEDRQGARRILAIARDEAVRVERKFSRYLDGNVVHRINHAAGEEVPIDAETHRLLAFAAQLFELSEGRFDITSGVLRRAWTFDGSDRVPSAEAVRSALQHVGWGRVRLRADTIRLEPGMQIDLGGIGKEYAVDRAAQLAGEALPASCVVNFGGDLAVTRPRRDGQPWRVGIEDPDSPTPHAGRLIRLTAGGLATSGDARRFLLKDGIRYSHILDPTTGWPIVAAPRSVTVAAGSCVQAGMLATLSMLQGAGARSFLEEQGVQYWLFE